MRTLEFSEHWHLAQAVMGQVRATGLKPFDTTIRAVGWANFCLFLSHGIRLPKLAPQSGVQVAKCACLYAL